jgi:type II secretory pathway component PulC
MKAALRHLNILNLALIALAALFASYLIAPGSEMKISVKAPQAQKKGPEKQLPGSPVMPPFADFTSIPANNIFHPERKMPVVTGEEEKPKPAFVLYGTLISDDAKIAYMADGNNPYSTPGRGERQRTLKEGESLSGYRLEFVEHDRVIMKKGDEQLIVMVFDPNNPKARSQVKVEKTAPAVKPPVRETRTKGQAASASPARDLRDSVKRERPDKQKPEKDRKNERPERVRPQRP